MEKKMGAVSGAMSRISPIMVSLVMVAILIVLRYIFVIGCPLRAQGMHRKGSVSEHYTCSGEILQGFSRILRENREKPGLRY
jgi:hypothetical protein